MKRRKGPKLKGADGGRQPMSSAPAKPLSPRTRPQRIIGPRPARQRSDCGRLSIVRERLVSMIAEIRNVGVIGEAEDGCKARALFLQQRPDAVILDVQTPRITGLDLIRAVQTSGAGVFRHGVDDWRRPEVG